MIIELEVNGARVIVTGENLTVNVTQEEPRGMYSDLGNALPLRDYLKAHGLTQEQFAEVVDAHVITINKILNGKRRPSWAMMKKIEVATCGAVGLASWIPFADEIDAEENIPSAIRAVRDGMGWTQKELAEAVGATQSEVSRWERGEMEPGARVFNDIMGLRCGSGKVSVNTR